MLLKKIKIHFIGHLLFASLLISCSKDKQTIIKNDWQVESIKVHADSALKFPSNIYILSFENRKKYSIKLDANTCSGKVNLKSNKKIEFKSVCTEICCDSDFAKNLISVLDNNNKYEVSDNILILTGENGATINLTKK